MKMKNKFIYIVLFLLGITVIFTIIFTIRFSVGRKYSTNSESENISVIDNQNKALLVGIENNNQKEEVKKEEIKKEEKKDEVVLDAATLTQQIYAMNSEIGTLYIPRTGLTTSIYSNSSVSQMEKMPCFLYTTGGLNKPGATLIVGHNKRNGKLFSNNKKIEEGDEFYFKDFEGKELKYVVYSKFITTDGDMTFLDSAETKPVIALSCCTDANDENRIIVLGRAEI
ncbi:MAG TPA: hypothetical protein DEP51_01035 [Clostridiales bacterium]|nr:hypothetical protein [Clostridiales bacterium]